MAQPHGRAGMAQTPRNLSTLCRHQPQRPAPGLDGRPAMGRCHHGHGRKTQIPPHGPTPDPTCQQTGSHPGHPRRIPLHGPGTGRTTGRNRSPYPQPPFHTQQLLILFPGQLSKLSSLKAPLTGSYKCQPFFRTRYGMVWRHTLPQNHLDSEYNNSPLCLKRNN